VGINYETGELSGNYSKIAAAVTSSEFTEVTRLQQEADPAILHLDVDLLRDIVLLSIATAIGGEAHGRT
jgi:hypothetical protein